MVRFRRWLTAAAVVGTAGCSPIQADRDAGSDVGWCLARGSRVRTLRGLRNIEDLAIGDEVLCLDPVTATFASGKLIAIRSATRECIRLSYEEGSLTLTSDHPIYSPDDGQWAPAGDWALGKRSGLLVGVGEEVRRVEVTEVTTFAGVFEVFDLTVDHPLHNFVAEGVLVHNKSPVQYPCRDRDGGFTDQYQGDTCDCPKGGEGHVMCPAGWAPHCAPCDEADGGEHDAGTSDAGTNDGGSGDGG